MTDLITKVKDIMKQKRGENYQKPLFYVEKEYLLNSALPEIYGMEAYYEKFFTINKSNLKEAKEYYRECLKRCMEQLDKTKKVVYIRGFAIIYKRLGELCMAEEDLKGARGYYENSLLITEELIKEEPTVLLYYELVEIYIRLGDECKAAGRFQEAKLYFEKAIETGHLIQENEDIVKYQLCFSVLYERLGDISLLIGDAKTAENYYQQSLQIIEELLETVEGEELQRNLIISYVKLGDLCCRSNNYHEASQYYEKSVLIGEKIWDAVKTVKNGYALLVAYERMGSLYKADEKCGEKKVRILSAGQNDKVSINKQKAIIEELEKKYFSNRTPQNGEELLAEKIKLGEIYREIGIMAFARLEFEKSIFFCEMLEKEFGTSVFKEFTSSTCDKLAEICEILGRKEQALEYRAFSGDYVLEETAENESKRISNLKYAKEYYEKCAEIAEELVNGMGMAEYEQELLSISESLEIFK